MQINSSNSRTVSGLLDPLKNSGGKLINNINLARKIVSDYKATIESYVEEMMSNLDHLPTAYRRQIKMTIFKQAMDKYRDIVHATGNNNAVALEVAKIIDSDDDFNVVEAKEEFGNYLYTYHDTYKQMALAFDGMREKFRPLAGFRFIPSFSPNHILAASIQAIKAVDSAQEGKGKSFTVNGVKMQGTKAKAIELLELLSLIINQSVLEMGHAMDMVDLVNRWTSISKDATMKMGVHPDLAFFFSNSSMAILPAFSLKNEDNMLNVIKSIDIKRVDGSTLLHTSLDPKFGWMEIDNTDKDVKDNDFKDPSLGNILLAIVAAWQDEGIDKGHVTLPLNCCPAFPLLNDIFSETHKEMSVEIPATFLDALIDIVSKGPNARAFAHSVYEENLSGALASDVLRLTTRARELMEKSVFGDISGAIKAHLDRVGTKKRMYVLLDNNTTFKLPSTYIDSISDFITLNGDRSFWDYSSVPLTTPTFSNEVITLKPEGKITSRLDTVKGDEANSLLNDLFKWEGGYRDEITLRIDKSDIEYKIFNDSDRKVSFYNDLIGPSNVLGSNSKPVFDYSAPPTLTSLSIGDVCASYHAPAPQGHIDLWKEYVHDPSHVVIGNENVRLHRSAETIKLKADSMMFGGYKGMYVPDSETLASTAIMDLTRRIYKTYFFAEFPTLTDEVKYNRTFKNKPYYKRISDFSQHFSLYKVQPAVYRLINHRMSSAYLSDSLDGNLLQKVIHGDLEVSNVFLNDLKTYAARIVKTLMVNYKIDSPAFAALELFLNGTLTTEAQNRAMRDDMIGLFDVILNILFGGMSGRSTLTTLVYTDVLIAEIMKQLTNERAKAESIADNSSTGE